MDTMTLLVAGLAAVAIIVIAAGVAMSWHGHSPVTSSRLQRRAGNHVLSMRMTRVSEPFGSSSVEYRSAARAPCGSLATRSMNCCRLGTGVPFTLEITAPRGTPAASST